MDLGCKDFDLALRLLRALDKLLDAGIDAVGGFEDLPEQPDGENANDADAVKADVGIVNELHVSLLRMDVSTSNASIYQQLPKHNAQFVLL